MKNLLTALFLLVSMAAISQPTQLNLLKQTKVFGGTGKSILVTNGTAVDTLKSSLSNSYLKWDGTDFSFATVSGASVDTTTEIATHYMLSLKLDKSDSVNISGYATNFKLLSYLTTSAAASTYQPLDADLTAIAGLSPSDDDIIQRKSGAWTNRSIAQLKADMIYSLNDVTTAGNTSTAGITVSGGNVMLTTVSSRGAISLRQSSPGPYTLDLYSMDLDDNYTLRFPSTSDTLLVRGDIVKGLMPTEIGTAAQQLRVNAGATGLEYFTPAASGSSTSWIRKYADQTMSTSAADVDNMSAAIAAYDSVYIECELHVGTSANNGVRYTVTIPSGATMKIFFMGTTSSTVGQGPLQILTTSGTQTTTIQAFATTTGIAKFTGVVINDSNAGIIQIQALSMNAGNTMTVYSGSVFKTHKN